MTQSIQSTSAVQIVHATDANIYTAAKDSARKKVLIAETIELYPSEREELADGLIASYGKRKEG